MADVRVFLEPVNVLFEAINWEIASLSENAASNCFFNGNLIVQHLNNVLILTCYTLT